MIRSCYLYNNVGSAHKYVEDKFEENLLHLTILNISCMNQSSLL